MKKKMQEYFKKEIRTAKGEVDKLFNKKARILKQYRKDKEKLPENDKDYNLKILQYNIKENISKINKGIRVADNKLEVYTKRLDELKDSNPPKGKKKKII